MPHGLIAQSPNSTKVTLSLLTYLVVVSSATFVLLKLFDSDFEDQDAASFFKNLVEPIEVVSWSVGMGVIALGAVLSFQLLFPSNDTFHGLIEIMYVFGVISTMFVSVAFGILLVKIGRLFSRYRMHLTWNE